MLKGLLKRAKTVLDSTGTQGSDTADTPQQFQHLDLIVVPQSAMDALPHNPDALVEAVVDYVNFLFHEAQFNRFEIAPEAVQLYHCDYYLAQVKAGGHAKFVADAEAVMAYIVEDVLTGLQAVDAKAHLGLAQEMADWIAQNPDAVEDPAGAEGAIALELSALDTPFREADVIKPLRRALAAWIAEVEVIQVVEDSIMPRVLEGIKLLNPKCHQRKAKTRIATLMNQLSNPVMLGLGMAGASATDPAPVLSLRRGAACVVDGKSAMTWQVQTADGPYFGIADDAGAQLRDYVVQASEASGEDQISVGPVVSRVSSSQVNAAKQICETLNAAIAIEALTSKLPKETSAEFASVRSASPDTKGVIGTSIFVIANKGTAAFSAVIDENGAKLLAEPSHDLLVELPRAEISGYIDQLQAV